DPRIAGLQIGHRRGISGIERVQVEGNVDGAVADPPPYHIDDALGADLLVFIHADNAIIELLAGDARAGRADIRTDADLRRSRRVTEPLSPQIARPMCRRAPRTQPVRQVVIAVGVGVEVN